MPKSRSLVVEGGQNNFKSFSEILNTLDYSTNFNFEYIYEYTMILSDGREIISTSDEEFEDAFFKVMEASRNGIYVKREEISVKKAKLRRDCLEKSSQLFDIE